MCIRDSASTSVLIVRYYRNLYGDEGYLMNTLPVTPAQHVWAKLICAFLWELGLSLIHISLVGTVPFWSNSPRS